MFLNTEMTSETTSVAKVCLLYLAENKRHLCIQTDLLFYTDFDFLVILSYARNGKALRARHLATTEYSYSASPPGTARPRATACRAEPRQGNSG